MFADVENYYERLVFERIQQIMPEHPEHADDPDYWGDVACVALNQLPARYIRYSIDLADRLTDAQWEEMGQAIHAAIAHALQVTRRRQSSRVG